MKFDLSSFDENSLQNNSKVQDSQDLSDESKKEKISQIEEEFTETLQNLVNINMKITTRANLTHIKDIFNSVSERLEKVVGQNQQEKMLLYLCALSIFLGNSYSNERVDNTKLISDILSIEDNILAHILSIKIMHVVSNKKQIYHAQKIVNIAQAYNLLRSKDNQITFLQLLNQQPQNTLEFEIDQLSQGLNERSSQVTISIPKEDILNSDQKSYDLAKDIATKNGQENESFISKLQVKIQWLRYQNTIDNHRQRLITIMEAIYVAYTLINEQRNQEFVNFMRDQYVQQSLEVVQQSSDTDVVYAVLLTMNQIFSKNQGGLIPLEYLTKPQQQNRIQSSQDQDPDEQKSILNKMLEDVASVKLNQDEFSNVHKSSLTKIFNGFIITNDRIQYQIVVLALTIIRHLQAQHRGTVHYNEVVNSVIGSLLKIVQDEPENQLYTYNPQVGFAAAQILKFIVRPRLEENNDIITKFEKRISFEVKHIEQNFYYWNEDECQRKIVDQKDRQLIVKVLLQILGELISRDQQGLGMGRKIMESHVIQNLHVLITYNNEEKGHLIDDILIKYYQLVGVTCSDNPAQIPILLKSEIIQDIIKSFEQRIPPTNEVFEQLLYGLNQFAIHEEGQNIVLTSSLFRKILELPTCSNKYAQSMLTDQMLFRMHLGNIFDRNAQFKEESKEVMHVYIRKLKAFAKDKAFVFIQNFRRTDISDEEKIAECQKDCSPQMNPCTVAALIMIYNFSFISNDNLAHNRHSQDIVGGSTFHELLDLFKSFMMVPSLHEYQPYFEKFMKVLIENSVYPQQVITYIDELTKQAEMFQNLLGQPIYKIEDFDFNQKEENQELKDIINIDLDCLNQYLTKGEQILFQLSKMQQLIKLTHYLHTQTFHAIIQNQNMLKVSKVVFYIQKILQKQKANHFVEQMENLQNNQESEDYKQFGQHLLKKYSQSENGSFQEKRERVSSIKNYLYQDLIKSFQAKRYLKLREKFFWDYLNKFSAQSFQARNVQHKEALDKNLMFIGKLVYKATKAVTKAKLDKIDIQPESKELLKTLFQVTQSLFEILSMVQQGWVDGVSFYMFVKKGGMNNLIECFEWLCQALHKIDNDFQQVYIFLFDESCGHMKQIMQTLINSRNNDTNINSILNANFGDDYENAKNLYQTFYHLICTKLLHLDEAQPPNLVAKLQHSRAPYLQDIVINLLRNASKSFSSCPLLKEGQRNDRDPYGRRGRNQADPVQVEMLMTMGLNFNRDRVSQALVQTNNNLDNAVNLLLEWQMQDSLGIGEGGDLLMDEGFSSDENDDEERRDLNSVLLNHENNNMQIKYQRPKKAPKVQETEFNEIVKKTQSVGFQWIIECQAIIQESSSQYNEVQNASFRDFIVTQMLNEKTEATQKQMYSEIDKIFKNNLARFGELISHMMQKEDAGNNDQQMEDINTISKEKQQESFQKTILGLQNDIHLILKLINNNKLYLKESIIKSDVFIKVSDLINKMVLHFNQLGLRTFLQDEHHNCAYQRLMHDSLLFCFNVLQLSQLQVNIYLTSKEQVDSCKKKAMYYQLKLPLKDLFNYQSNILDAYKDQQNDDKKLKFKKAIVATAGALAIKILTGSQFLSKFEQEQIFEKSLALFNRLNLIQGPKIIDSQVQNSTLILHLEDQKILQSSMEKLSLKVLYLKYEHDTKNKEDYKQQQQQEETLHLKSAAGFNNFLKYFNALQQRDTNTFKQVLKDNFDVKTVKKLNTLSQDQATIHIKSGKFVEIIKQTKKERGQLKQLIKSFDFKNDKQIKSIIQTSKKQLLSTLNEHFQKSTHQVIEKLSQNTSTFLEEYALFNQQHQGNQKFTIKKDQNVDLSHVINQSQLDTICQLSLAYPAVTVPILQSHPQPKRSFTNWYIKDYLVAQMLQRTSKLVRQKEKKPEDMDISNSSQQPQMVEVTYSLTKQLNALSSKVFTQLNNLTAYNHLMTLHEQAVKHNLRTKFMFEALQILQRSLKDKATSLQQQSLQKCHILASLLVIETLINFTDETLTKHQVLAQDNFINSIRVAIQRDASNKDSQLPYSLIKLIDELMGDIIDVTLESNSLIVGKVVSILNVLAEFINNEKKKEEKRLKDKKLPSLSQLPNPSSLEEVKQEQIQQHSLSEQMRLEDSSDPNLRNDSEPLVQHHSDNLQRGNLNFQFQQDDDNLDVNVDVDDEEEDDDGIMMEDDVDMHLGGGADQEDDEDDEDDDDGEGDDMEDAEGDEDDIYDDDDELQPDAIVVGRNNAIFDEDEDGLDDDEDGLDDDEEEIVVDHHGGWGIGGAGNRQQRQQDIINMAEPQQDARGRQYIRFHDINQDFHRRGGAVNINQNWSEEEAEVQRILSQMRGNQNQQQQVVPPQQQQNLNHPWAIYRNNRDAPAQAPGVQGIKPTSFIDQMYESLKPISEKEFMDMVNKHKQMLEDEIQEELKNAAQPAEKEALQNLVQARQAINQMHRRLDDMNDMIIDIDFPDLAALEGGPGQAGNLGMFQALNQLMRQERDLMAMPPPFMGGGIANPMLDPLFMRPPIELDINGRPLNMNLFGGGYHPPAPQVLDRQNANNDNALFNYYTRNQAQVQANLNDELGQQLLEQMNVQVEEEKGPIIVEDNKSSTIKTSEERKATEEIKDNLTNDQLLNQFFAPLNVDSSIRDGGDMIQSSIAANADNNIIPPFDLGNLQQPGPGQASSPRLVPQAQEQNDMQRIEERSRQLRDEIERQHQDIQNIINQQNTQQLGGVDVQMQEDNNQIQQQQQINDQVQQQNQIQPVQDQINQINISDDANLQANSQASQQQQQQQVQQINNAGDDQQMHNDDDISAFDDQPIQQPPMREEEKKQEEVKNDQQQQNPPISGSSNDNMTCGYDNDLLLAHGIDPSILLELPEDLRAELLSTIDLPPAQQLQQQQQQQQQQDQPAVQQQQQVQPGQEEQKQQEGSQQQQQPNSQGSNPVNDIANELGLDPEFLANLPEDMQLELIQNEQFRQRNLGQQQQQVPQREPEQMDVASFIATVVDPALRREIFSNMDEATVASLPPNLMAEARRVHEQIRNERHRYRDNFDNMERRARGLLEQIDPRYNIGGGAEGIFARRPGAGRGEEAKKDQQIGGKPLEEVVLFRHQQLFEEMSNEDFVQLLTHQLAQDEKILEQLLLVLIGNPSVNCALLPCIQNLIKVHSNGLPVIRNKVLNAITFLLKSIATNDDEGIKAIYPNVEIKKKQSALILIGCLRLLLRTNRSLMKQILKGLFVKAGEENVLSQTPTKRSTQILKKQHKYINQKLGAKNEQQEISSLLQQEDQIMTNQGQSKNGSQILPALAEIFYLIRTDMFKNDKSLLRNLSILIHQILKSFDIALDEIGQQNTTISSDTIQSIAEVLSLDIIDQGLMQDLGEFLFRISEKKKENFYLISEYCNDKVQQLVNGLTQRLTSICHSFNDMRNRVSPGKMQILENYSPSQPFGGDSIYEEEKSEMMIDTSTNPLQELQRQTSTSEIRNASLKLQDEDEKSIKQQLRMSDQSEMLLRILKLFSLFFDKFTTLMNDLKLDQEGIHDENITSQEFQQMINYIHEIYKSDKMSHFVKMVSNVMRIAYKTNTVEGSYENLSTLLFCVFSIYFPELIQSIKDEEEQAKLLKALPDSTDKSQSQQKSKYQIKMMSLEDSQNRQNKLVIFKNQNFFTNRVQEFSNFCLANKRLINKLIKSKPQLFNVELEGLVKHMPNLLDFDNKRGFFRRELTKLKRTQAYNTIQLYIRRDDIFMDSYAQISIRQPEEMKGRLQIQFTGERGQDAGGLTRDFFIELSRQMFNPNYSLFVLSSSGSTYYPNPKSYIQADHLRYFKFIGRVVGKALFEDCLLECHFVKSFYKIITGEPLMISDLEDFDNEFYNNLKWCMENDITALETTFVVEQDHFGKTQDYDLIENGANIPVTNENKNLYIEKLVHFKLYKSIQQQIDAFLEGFYEMIPKDLISIFTHKELELQISGLPNFDLNDLKQNTEYMGYNAQSPQVQWMWEILETFDNEDRAQFLQFVTGSSKVPVDGFKGLMGMRGPQKFTIAKIKSDDILRLPSGHTCFNQIDIPEYPSKEIMHERLLTAIKETKGFGFA